MLYITHPSSAGDIACTGCPNWLKYQAREPPASVAVPAPVSIADVHDEYSCELELEDDDVRYTLIRVSPQIQCCDRQLRRLMIFRDRTLVAYRKLWREVLPAIRTKRTQD
jgi:hypothetical protein